MKKYPIGKTVNLVELSDVFRRHAKFTDKKAARQLVKSARRVACLSTYYYPEYQNSPSDSINKSVDNSIKWEICRMAYLAQKLGIKEIELPIENHKENWPAQRIQNNILKVLSLPVGVKLQKGVYKKDNAGFGRIDKRITTALDQGIRGVAGIAPDLKAKWDNPKFKP